MTTGIGNEFDPGDPPEVHTERKRGHKRKPRKESRNFERDMAIMRATAPVEVGGGGMLNREAAEKFGVSTQRVQQIVNEPDIQEQHKGWLQKMFSKQRSTGDKVHAAFEALVEAGDARVVIDYFRRMGVDVGPGVDVNIQKLELTLPEGVSDLLKLNPAYQERNDAENDDRIEEGEEASGPAALGSDA